MTCRTQAAVSDYGPADRSRHHVVKPELTGRGHAVRMRVRNGTELDRLSMKGLINPFQHSAGTSFARDLHGARMLGVKTTSFGQSLSGGGTQGDGQTTALDRVGDAIRVLDKTVGVAARTLTLNVCLSLVEIKGEDILTTKQGLDVLLSHYDRRHAVLKTEDLLA